MALTAPTLGSFFDLNHSASPRRGWMVFLAALGAGLIAEVAGRVWPGLVEPAILLAVIANLALVVVIVQRLNQIGRNGLWALLAFVPFLGLLAFLWVQFARPAQTPTRPQGAVRGIVVLGMTLVLLGGLTRALGLWHPFFIPSESQKPTLLVGDYVIATPAGEVAPGDVLIFRHPVTGADHVSRLVGLPGDRVQMRDGILFLNGKPAPQEAKGEFSEVFEPQGAAGNLPKCQNAPVAMGGTCTRELLVETLPEGRQHAILNSGDTGFPDRTDVYTVPEGSLFFLGDNRDNAMDSRFGQEMGGPGFVPMENLRYKARVILFSSAGSSLLSLTRWRGDRFFKVVE